MRKAIAKLMTWLILPSLVFLSCQGASQPSVLAEECCVSPEGVIVSSSADYYAYLKQSDHSADDDMMLIPGGKVLIGSETGLEIEKPVFLADVEPFYMDKYLVTVADFRSFIEATGYVTEAEQIGDGIMFDFERAEWTLVPGLTWEYPGGEDAGKAPDNHPVTMVSYQDAVAYLKWKGKRLPTQIEWEHAAKGLDKREERYSWGNSLIEDEIPMANTWTGVFPWVNTGDDGYLTTSPVGMFGANDFSLYDMGGNVWEWTSDWFRPYDERDKPFTPTETSEKVLKGGSFMCHESYCHGYRVSARSNTPPTNTMFHIGFRGVRDITSESRTESVTPVLKGFAENRLQLGKKIIESDFSEASDWVIQIEPKSTDLEPEISFTPGLLDVWMPDRGATLWNRNPFKGPITFIYRVSIPTNRMLNSSDRMMPRDLNVFWHASDPTEEQNELFNSMCYTGKFSSYDKQKGYYASTGGGANTTTRFRRYPREEKGVAVQHIALTSRDGDSEYLIQPSRTYTIQLVAADDLIQYLVNGRVVYEIQEGENIQIQRPDGSTYMTTYSIEDFPPYTSGWFGFRLLKSHHQFHHFSAYQLEWKG